MYFLMSFAKFSGHFFIEHLRTTASKQTFSSINVGYLKPLEFKKVIKNFTLMTEVQKIFFHLLKKHHKYKLRFSFLVPLYICPFLKNGSHT